MKEIINTRGLKAKDKTTFFSWAGGFLHKLYRYPSEFFTSPEDPCGDRLLSFVAVVALASYPIVVVYMTYR